MTLHETRIIYPDYRRQEWNRRRWPGWKALDLAAESGIKKRAGCGCQTEPALTSDTERSVADG